MLVGLLVFTLVGALLVPTSGPTEVTVESASAPLDDTTTTASTSPRSTTSADASTTSTTEATTTTTEAEGDRDDVLAAAVAATADSTTTAPTTTRPRTTTTQAPAPTAPPTTRAPTTTAPPTTQAPTTTAPPTTQAPTTTAAPEPEPSSDDTQYAYDDPRSTQVWYDLAQCESGGNWSINTGNGYYGGLQFSKGSWDATGGDGYPHHHSAAVQIDHGRILQSMQGWGAWPHCSRKLGLR